MYKKILVPLDGSELAEEVFTYAKELAGRLNLDVVLLHVSSSDERDSLPMRQAYIEQRAGIIERDLEKARPKGTKAGGELPEVHGEVVAGYPPEEILRYADEHDVDLILLATHGRSGQTRWALGNVADKVLRTTKVPVWLVHSGIPEEIVYDKWPTRRVLVALDGSELAEAVLPHAEEWAIKRGPERVEVVLLRVCEPLAMPTYYTPELSGLPLRWGEYEQQEIDRCKQESQEYLAALVNKLAEKGITARSEVLFGKAAEEIINYANKNPFNLIIMATHGRSGVGRLVYGSVAASVLQGVMRPLLVVKPQQTAEKK
ncbi:MAG: universal stress protein [Chloroflexota bacterium]